MYKWHLIFYQRLYRGTIPNGEQTKANMKRGIMLIRTFFLKVISNDRKVLTHHEIIDRIAKQIVKIIKIVVDPNLRRPNLHIDIWTLKKEFCSIK